MITNGLESKVVKNKELAVLAELAVLGCSWADLSAWFLFI
jgi:hypothetical protein